MGFARYGLVVVLVALSSAVGLAHRAGATASSSVGVTETEYRITLGRTTVPHGRITLYIANFGQDDHNLKVARRGLGYAFSGRIAAGGHIQMTVTLRRGVYNLYCAIPGHRQLGMVRKLTVA